jgi:PIN domain nuclease of toxin-antitoxin system
MRYLLDTHVRAGTRATTSDPRCDVAVSVASIWEAAIKRAVGKLRFETSILLDTLSRGDIRVIPITAAHALAAGDLSRHHGDGMLVAQALAEGLTLISRDARLRAYEVAIVEA